MNKIISIILLLILAISSTFAYNPSIKDTRSLNNLYKTIDVLHEAQPDRIDEINNKLKLILPTLKKDNQQKYIITELSNYISNKLNKSEEIISDEENIQYDVIEVIDWDTIKINYNWENINIRMIWIDSPENSTTRFWYVENYWDEAKVKLKELIWNNKITIELDETQWEYDKYNRLLAYVFIWSININSKMIESWYAKEYTYNKAYKYQSEFKKAQKNAESSKLWIWKEVTEEKTTNNTEKIPSDKVYIIWPEWWCYYINSNWNKSYVEKSYCWIIEKIETIPTSTINSNTSSGRIYYTWPKWWCYYYNSKWNKSYVDRSLCK